MPICLAFRSDILLPTTKYVATGWEISSTLPGNFTRVQEQEIHLVANETCKKVNFSGLKKINFNNLTLDHNLDN